jgi:trehalose 6-phosphate synthase
MACLDFEGRLIIVSNRLPVTIRRRCNGRYDFTASSGGLVTGLSGLANSGVEYLWYGWPGSEIPKEDISEVQKDLLQKHKSIPVLLDRNTAQKYYDGFSSTCCNH